MDDASCRLCDQAIERRSIMLESEHFWVRYDPYPRDHGHLNIIAQRHGSRHVLSREEANDLRQVIDNCQHHLKNTFLSDGYEFARNTRASGSDRHLIFDVIPVFVPKRSPRA